MGKRRMLVGIGGLLLAAAPMQMARSATGSAVDEQAEALLKRMTLAEKVSLMAGNSEFSTPAIPRLGIPSLRMADGPNGIRSNETWPATVFPASIAIAATWDRDTAAAVARAIGEEARQMDYQLVMGPAMNIERLPLGGRSFEYFSEDPFLSGDIAAHWIAGLQSVGIGATAKHFAANNQEALRKTVDAQVPERALREIYLANFGRAMKAQPWMVMTAYNRVNGQFASESPWLLRDVLRGDLGFDGVIVSDWGAAHDMRAAANAGLGLEMPGPPKVFGDTLVAAVERGEIPAGVVDDAARRMLEMIIKSEATTAPHAAAPLAIEPPAHAKISLDAAEQAITLLKNEGDLLPLDMSKLKTLAIIGPNADARVIEGGGSSEVIPLKAETALDGIRAAVGDKVGLVVRRGADNDRYPPVADPRLFSPTLARDSTGLAARYWTGGNIEAGAPVHVVAHDDVFMRFYFGENYVADPERHLAIRWQGYFWPPVDGVYEFSLFDHGNIDLSMDGKLILDRNAPAGPPPMYEFLQWKERTARITLRAGHPYPITVDFRPGTGPYPAYRLGIRVPSGPISAAVDAARKADAAIVFVGTSTTSEAEGADRDSLRLYGDQDALVSAVAAANPRTIVVLTNGGPVEMPWLDTVPAVLDTFFLGGHTGTAIADTLFGKSNPSGKLPISFPKRLADNPTAAFYNATSPTSAYNEGLLVGYRWYDAKKIEPLFPFGFGLSYTRFAFDSLKVTKSAAGWRVSATIRNIGSSAGAEVAQLYVGMPAAADEPPRQLKGYQKIAIPAGESRTVDLPLAADDLRTWDDKAHRWTTVPGRYRVWLGSSSRDLPLHADIDVGSEVATGSGPQHAG